jgi:hypothetical protein
MIVGTGIVALALALALMALVALALWAEVAIVRAEAGQDSTESALGEGEIENPESALGGVPCGER